jgi:hypothetical protein
MLHIKILKVIVNCNSGLLFFSLYTSLNFSLQHKLKLYAKGLQFLAEITGEILVRNKTLIGCWNVKQRVWVMVTTRNAISLSIHKWHALLLHIWICFWSLRRWRKVKLILDIEIMSTWIGTLDFMTPTQAPWPLSHCSTYDMSEAL